MQNLPVTKYIREGIICLFSLSKYLFSAAILSCRSNALISVSISTPICHHNKHIALDEKSFLFGVYKNQDVNKLVLMEIKYYIYYSRCSKNNMNLTALKHRLKLLYQTHKQASVSEGKHYAFQIKWQKYHDLLR